MIELYHFASTGVCTALMSYNALSISPILNRKRHTIKFCCTLNSEMSRDKHAHIAVKYIHTLCVPQYPNTKLCILPSPSMFPKNQRQLNITHIMQRQFISAVPFDFMSPPANYRYS